VIQISPTDFVKPSAQAIEDNIHDKYSNKVLQDVGLCICFWDMLKASEGLISQGDGMVNVNGRFGFPASGNPFATECNTHSWLAVVFRLVVFRPFKGEIIQGSIIDANPEGLRSTATTNLTSKDSTLADQHFPVGLDFFSDIWIPASNLFDGSALLVPPCKVQWLKYLLTTLLVSAPMVRTSKSGSGLQMTATNFSTT
jgi:DNA-directed RNA polymerase III subunit RPC8